MDYKSFDTLNNTFNIDGSNVDLDEDLHESDEEVTVEDKKDQKYKLRSHEYLYVEYQQQVERLRTVAEEMRQCCKVGAPPRMFEVYAGMEDKISGILDKIKQLEETETDYQIVETKETLAKQKMELKQQNALRKLEKSNSPTTLVQQNIQQNYMTSSELLNKTLELMNDKMNVITDEKDLPQFDLE